MIKTYYPHWGEYTAFNAIIKYFDTQQFKVKMCNVPMGDDRFRFPFFKAYLHRKIKARRVQEYKLNDLNAELSVLGHTLFRKTDIVLFLDAEHTLMFLPYWYKKLSCLKTFPKIIAMFHQPPTILKSLVNIDIIRQVDHVLVVSPEQAAYFAQYLSSECISTILLGVDTGHFRPCTKSRKKKKPKTFKCLSGGIWLRDYEVIVETAKLLQEREPYIEFHVVAPRGTVNCLDMTKIILHENISDRELLKLYQSCDILFLPLQDATANTFLLEGIACGLPIVSSYLNSIKTYFPGDEAVLIKNNDPSAFAWEIRKLKRNPDQLSRRSDCARRRALELSWKNIVKEYEALFMNV